MLVCVRDGPAQTGFRPATLRQNLWIKLSFSSGHSLLAPGQPAVVPMTSGRVATGLPIVKTVMQQAERPSHAAYNSQRRDAERLEEPSEKGQATKPEHWSLEQKISGERKLPKRAGAISLQSDQHWYSFLRSVRETPERRARTRAGPLSLHNDDVLSKHLKSRETSLKLTTTPKYLSTH